MTLAAIKVKKFRSRLCATFCTHSLPLNVIISYLLESFKFEAIIIGIQPKSLTFGAQPTKEVVAAAKNIAKAITKLLTNR